MVETTLDLASLDTHTYTIKPEYDEGLLALAEKIMEVSCSCFYPLSEMYRSSLVPGLMHVL